jgi:dipeptidyl aminopeptidase/acylaminoacyl peptidase
MRRLISSALFSALLATLVAPSGSRAAPDASPSSPVADATAGPLQRATPVTARKVAIDYKAYDSWNLIRGTKLSDDGNWIAYVLTPEDGDPTLVVRNLNSGAEIKEERGMTPAFTPDSKFVVYTIRTKNDEIHKAEREHKPAAEQPKSGLGILDLSTGKSTRFDRVKSLKLPRDPGSTTIAFLFESPSPSPKPSGSPPASASAPGPSESTIPTVRRTPTMIASPSPNRRVPLSEATALGAPSREITPLGIVPSPAPSPSASPDELHKIEDGTELVIRDLPAAKQVTVKNVTEYALSHDGAYVAYATESAKDAKLDGFHVRASGDGKVADLFAAPGHYKNLAFAPKDELLAFMSDQTSFAEKAPHYDLYEIDLGHAAAAPGAASEVAGPAIAGMPKRWAPSANATPLYSKDGRRLFFGTAPAPTPVPSGTPEPLKVDIWSWRDGDLQPYQKINADKERRRTYSALVADKRFVQLASPAMRNIVTTENPDFALGINDVPYRNLISWEGELYADQYAVSLHDGSRRLLARKSADPGQLSPDGRFVVGYDPKKRDWYSLDTRNAKRLELTANLKVAFYDELDDHPAPPPSYGFGGWVEGGRYALLLDRYDVWVADVSSGKAWMLTQGEGRKAHARLFPLGYEYDRDSYDVAKPVPLLAFNDDNKDSGLYVARFSGPIPQRVRKVTVEHKYIANYQKARNADRVVVSEQRFDDPLNLWSASSIENRKFAKISDANPQKAKYLWGSARLISYKSTWGVPLHGILLLPENFDRKKKYPMLVYFYERESDTLNHPPFSIPAPGTSPDLLRYVSNGYVVLYPDIAYRIGHPGRSALGCILPAIDTVTQQGFIDEKRIGIAGHSWAAYQIAYMITQTHRFAAAEAGAAVADMISAYGGIRWESGLVREFQYERNQSRIGATPWDRTDLYLENSPLFHIKNITTPYLTIANDADGAVPWYQGIEFITALRRLDKPAWMFEFDGEEHNLRNRENQKYWTVHLDEFFDHYLKGAPEPAWMKQDVPYIRRGEREIRALYGEKP